MNSLEKVLIFGGTHGNEWTGVYAIQKYQDDLKKEFPFLDLHFIHSNPEAYRLNRRFKDEDLNRAFQFLHENRPGSYENQRAKEIKKLIEGGTCFIIDLHTTTSNMGNTVIITREEEINFKVAAELVSRIKDTRIIVSPDPQKKYLGSQSDFGLMIEVGPVPNSVIHPLVLENTLQILREVLRSVSTLHSLTETSMEIYEESEDVFYPRNEKGELTAYIHPSFQGKDFEPLTGEYIPFKTFEGEDLKRKTAETLYPIFINEAAYYPTSLAFTLCRKKMKNL